MAQQTLQGFTYSRAYTPDDSADIPMYLDRMPDALWVSVAGDVVVVFHDASTVTFGCADGMLLPIGQVKRVNATLTTATGIIALWQM